MTDDHLVDTPAGRLRGTAQPDGGTLFAGIPFAAPPVGPLRLRPPRPPAPWSGVRDATTFRPGPPQSGSPLVGTDTPAAGVPLLIGTNRDEMRLFQAMQGAAYTPADESALLAEIGRANVADPPRLLAAYRSRFPEADLAGLRTRFLTDAVYRRPASALAAAQVAAGGEAFAYLFSAATMGADLGAAHGADLLALFDYVDPANTALRTVRDELTGAWARFAATGDPGWPRYSPSASPNTRQFGDDPAMITELPADEPTAVWSESAPPSR